MRPTLYVTIDGVLDHLGYSQVVRVVEALAAQGVPYALVSLERERDLQNTTRVAAVRNALAARDIRWESAAYREGGARETALNLATLTRLAAIVARQERVSLVHARGYHGGVIAAALRSTLRIPYIFDARAAWVDERLEEGRWFTTPTRLALARAAERRLYRDARAIVTLTAIHADEVARYAQAGTPDPIVVPTCADYETFRILETPPPGVIPLDIVERLRGKRVLAIVGSLNRSYLGDETAAIAARVVARREDARVLVLTAQADAWQQCLARAGVPDERVVATRADHEAMPAWLSLATWGLLILRADTPAKRGSMPTKLAEFFAAGVRPVVHGCNAEVRDWVRRAGSGVTLDGLDDASVAAAAARICDDGAVGPVMRAREITQPHFSLQSGVARYETLLRDLSSAIA